MNNYKEVLTTILRFRKMTGLKPYIIAALSNNGLRGYGWSFRTKEFTEFFTAWLDATDYDTFKAAQLATFSGTEKGDIIELLFQLYETKALQPEIVCNNVNGFDYYGIVFYDKTLYLVFRAEREFLRTGLSDATFDIIDSDIISSREQLEFPEVPIQDDSNEDEDNTSEEDDSEEEQWGE